MAKKDPNNNLFVVCRQRNGKLSTYLINIPDDYPKTVWPDYDKVCAAVQKNREKWFTARHTKLSKKAKKRIMTPVQVLLGVVGDCMHLETDWQHLHIEEK